MTRLRAIEHTLLYLRVYNLQQMSSKGSIALREPFQGRRQQQPLKIGFISAEAISLYHNDLPRCEGFGSRDTLTA